MEEHYASKPQFSASRGFRAVFAQVLYCALGIHALLLCLFYVLDVAVLVAFNIASVSSYLACIYLMQHARPHTALLIACTELILHSLVATLLLGWSSGFHYYLLILPPLLFLSDLPIRLCLVSVIGLALGYVEFNVLFESAVGTEPVSDTVLALLRHLNMCTAIAAIGLLSFMYRSNVTAAVSRLQKLAATDPLTGLTNRREFFRLAAVQAQLPKGDTGYSLVLCDIDNFKQVNDRHGHEAGDRLLISVCDVLRATTRTEDLVVRWGGEEFLIMLTATNAFGALRVAEGARRAVVASGLRIGDTDTAMTMTFGVAERHSGESLEACIARADDALRAGKSGGKNRIENAITAMPA